MIFDLVFVAVYQKILQLLYIDELLQAVKETFCTAFGENLKDSLKAFNSQNYSFDEQFNELYMKISQEAKQKKSSQKIVPRFEDTEKGKKIAKSSKKQTKKPSKKVSDKAVNKSPSDEDEDDESLSPPRTPEKKGINSQESSPSKLPPDSGSSSPLLDKKKGVIKQGGSRRVAKKHRPEKVISESGPSNFKLPKSRVEETEIFNYGESKSSEPAPLSSQTIEEYGVREKIDLDGLDELSSEEEEYEDDEEGSDTPQKKTGETSGAASGGLLRFFRNITNKELTEADLKPLLENFKAHLISKNVAQEIAEKLCESVNQNLVGKKLGTFARVSTAVREVMEEALTRILTPKRSIDILREARSVNASKQGPYVIVFVGVNGVGKSTSLAKVCSWLQQNDMQVLICACDTFRSGAVEQLQVHANNLGVPLYHKGYGKDAAHIAFEGITKARRENKDVVLVDTAGRMQDKEPLMRALAKLVGMNKPHLVLFVGEALVGNEAVDQLQKFNRALEEFSTEKIPRGIDGIFLTKFDTVDEKVGAAISMAYTTGQPIVFVGVGQKYSDLRALHVKKIVSILLKGH